MVSETCKAFGLLAAFVVLSVGCSALWPTVVGPSPRDPLFDSKFPLVGVTRIDGALCSMSTVGHEATLLVSPPEPMSDAMSLEQACRQEIPRARAQHGRVGQLVSLSTAYGPLYGYLFMTPAATGLLVAFAGFGMPSAGWINEHFAEVGARQGLITFAVVRDETERPIYFDPVREGRRALDAAVQIQVACHIGAPAEIGFVGVSMGGLEALLANREALSRGMSTRAAVLDPILDVNLVIANLDSFWHSLSVGTMQAYFRRILRGRYHESASFRAVMERTRSHCPRAMTDLDADSPRAWLCNAPRRAYTVFLSDTDPVLGDAQREFIRSCGFPVKSARVPGHIPLACRLDLFQQMINEVQKMK